MTTITANDVKRQGVASIAEALKSAREATISVRGKKTYVVMSIEQFQLMREYELEAALLEARADREAGRIAHTTIAEHISQLKNG
jgi:PHD/YefM family antitoxin component YafN of YafNO toxin-antitoxin module